MSIDEAGSNRYGSAIDKMRRGSGCDGPRVCLLGGELETASAEEAVPLSVNNSQS